MNNQKEIYKNNAIPITLIYKVVIYKSDKSMKDLYTVICINLLRIK